MPGLAFVVLGRPDPKRFVGARATPRAEDALARQPASRGGPSPASRGRGWRCTPRRPHRRSITRGPSKLSATAAAIKVATPITTVVQISGEDPTSSRTRRPSVCCALSALTHVTGHTTRVRWSRRW